MKFKQKYLVALSTLVAALLGGALVLSCSKSDTTQDSAGGGGGAAGEGGVQNEAGANGGGSTTEGSGGGAAAGGAGGMPMAGAGGTKSGGTGGVSNGGAGGTGMMNAGGAPNTGGTPVMPASDCKAPACDGFESYGKGNRPGGPWSGFEVGSGAGLAVDDGKAFSGTKSLKVSVTPGGDLKARMNRSGPSGSEVFVRLMLFVEKKITGQGVFHWNFTTVEGGGTHVVSGGNAQGRTFQHYIGAGRDCYIHGSNPLPVGKWTCVEFHVNGQTDDAETYFNGVLDEFTQVTKGDPIPGNSGCLAGSGTGWNLPNPQTIRVGFAMAHQLDNPATMWMDDIVVSDKRVGCPK